MASNVLKFPVGKSAPFLEAADHYLDAYYPHFTEEERAALKARLVAAMDRHNLPWTAVVVPTEALAGPESAALVSQAIESQLLPLVHSTYWNMMTELFFHHCYSFGLEVELARRGK